ncbi:hypothetical protein E308F_10950 [Moorella sp. E308F]|uniref:ABC-three component system middle component 6 n=1 Tax=Moorella sp. E308F TaxID=2572682 RepID=UPI0010FFB081|nr:hypothetical protein E308F_10950 [Moorella sp. E308F]
MILPSKHMANYRSLLGIGFVILQILDRPQTVSSLWEKLSELAPDKLCGSKPNFAQFVLCLDMLFTLGTIRMYGGVLTRSETL